MAIGDNLLSSTIRFNYSFTKHVISSEKFSFSGEGLGLSVARYPLPHPNLLLRHTFGISPSVPQNSKQICATVYSQNPYPQIDNIR